MLGVLGRLAVDLVDLDQREITFAVFRGADFAFDGVAGMQIEAANLRGRYIDVIGAGQIRGVGRTQETEAVRQHFQSATAEDRVALFRLILEQRKNQFLLPEAVRTIHFVGDGHLDQFTDREIFQIG